MGSILIDPDAMLDVSEVLTAEDFYVARHRRIFAAMADLHRDGTPIDYVTLNDATEHQFDVALSGMIGVVPSAMSARAYAEKVKEMAVRRRLVKLCSDVVSGAYDYDLDVQAALDRLDQGALELHRAAEVGDTRAKTVEQIMAHTYDELQRAQAGEYSVISTGYRDMDRILTGFRLGGLYIVAARTGIGKTSQLLTHAVRMARDGKHAAVFSLEMSHQDVAHRLLTMSGAARLQDLVTGRLTKEQWENVADATGEIGELPIIVDDTPALTLAQIRSRAMRLKLQGRLDAVFVDYLQLVRVDVPRGTARYREIGIITQGLKQLAKELQVPVIVAAQLGRDAENARPSLRDLRESGDIEQDADGVIFLHRERDDNASVDQVDRRERQGGSIRFIGAEIIIAKHRHGPTGTMDALWIPSKASYVGAGEAV